MAKKKSKQPSGEQRVQSDGVQPGTSVATTKPSQTASNSASKKSPKSSKTEPAVPPPQSPLVISRNKHWKYISSFHGPWLQIPLEILETIANINYNTPRPRPIDPAVFFDLVKVRRLVDEATNLAVRAASDIASSTLTNVNGSFSGSSSTNSAGTRGPGHGAKLSRERKFRMREQASQKLGRAFRLDEIACSVATMQGASPLEEVGNLVLQRNPNDPDAKYVHFFQEKIPSRQLAESTSIRPLTEILSDRPGEPEALRTRATVKVFKGDFEGAIVDITHALSVARLIMQSHKSDQDSMQLQEPQRTRKRPPFVILAEKDQPSSFETQLFFHRASVYLTLACQHAIEGMPNPEPQAGEAASNGGDDRPSEMESNGISISDSDKERPRKRPESRRLVKVFARRAIKDYLAFMSQFDYSPNLPVKIVKEFNDRLNIAANGFRNSRSFDSHNHAEPHTVYALPELFTAGAPPDLPRYPPEDIVKVSYGPPPPPTSCEWATFHPLLTEALHSFLLAHCLAQTPTKELQRHAYMVARLVRLSDGYPVFQSSRAPARSDWVEILRRAENWLQLDSHWDVLCVPAPLPTFENEFEKSSASRPTRAITAGGPAFHNEGEERRKGRIREQAILDALDDERVVDEASFCAAIKVREKRAEQDHNLATAKATNGSEAPAMNDAALEASLKRRPADDGKECPILTQRATAISRWVCEAPVVAGTTRRKKRTKKVGSKAEDVDDVEEGVDKLELEEPTEV